MSSDDELPLPYGWVREVDPRTNHPFYVDTKAEPPRAIWVHPYEDEQYLSEHPDVREKVGNMMKEHEAKQSRPASGARRHSFHGTDSPSMANGDTTMANGDTTMAVVASSKDKNKHKRGFFGKMKDKAIGTKEEREAYKREMERQDRERRKQLELMRAEALRQRQAHYQQYQQYPGQPYDPYAGPSSSRWGPPPGDPYANYGAQQQRGFGGGGFGGGGFGGAGLPMLGALAGGLLLGDLLF